LKVILESLQLNLRFQSMWEGERERNTFKKKDNFWEVFQKNI